MLTTMLKGLAVGAAVFASAAALAFEPLPGDPEVLNVGIISTESTSNLKTQWEPFLADMEAALGMEVKAFFAPDYAGIIEGMRFGKVHVAWFGNKSAMEAVDRAGAEIFAQQAKLDGTAGYYSHLITHVDNGEINSLEDVLACDQSLNFGIGDPNSTSGYLVPTYYVFAQNGVDPRGCFKTVRNANHETNLMAVANKQVHVAANNSEQIARTQANQPDIASQIKVIWTSPLIPSDPMVYRTDLSVDLKAKIKGFFLSYGRMGDDVEHALEVLAGMSDGQAPFLDSDNTQLYPIRQLELYKDRIKVEGDDTLAADDKAARIAEIDARLQTLSVLMSEKVAAK